MADTAISGLTATTTVTDDDLFVVVDDPAGTPVTKKITAANLKASLGIGATGTSSSGYFDTADSAVSVTVAASATPHTKGSWVDVITSAAHAADVLIVTIGNASQGINSTSQDSSSLIDVGLWNGSSYDVLIADLLVGQSTAGKTYIFNLAVASGARLGARMQALTPSRAVGIHFALRQAGSSVAAPTSVTTIGADTAASTGTVLTTAPVANSEGDWLQLTASTAAAYRKMVIGLSAIANSSVTAALGAVDIGVWNGSAYDVVIGDVAYSTNSSEQIITAGNQMWFDVNIPSGADIAARYRSSSNSSAAKPNVAIYCSP